MLHCLNMLNEYPMLINADEILIRLILTNVDHFFSILLNYIT